MKKKTKTRTKSEKCPPRDYLRQEEVGELIEACNDNSRYPLRDKLIILMMYRHGLRCQELVSLKWNQIDFPASRIHITRVKNGNPSVQPLSKRELRWLRLLKKRSRSKFIFMSERNSPLTTRNIQYMLKRIGEIAGLEVHVHPHMLRHGCGFYLASKGTDTRTIQDYLGHRAIRHTVRYTQLEPSRFDNLWDD